LGLYPKVVYTDKDIKFNGLKTKAIGFDQENRFGFRFDDKNNLNKTFKKKSEKKPSQSDLCNNSGKIDFSTVF